MWSTMDAINVIRSGKSRAPALKKSKRQAHFANALVYITDIIGT